MEQIELSAEASALFHYGVMVSLNSVSFVLFVCVCVHEHDLKRIRYCIEFDPS